MKISEVIKKLEKYKQEYGDVELFQEGGDGRESWISSYKPKVQYRKYSKVFMISQDGY